MTDTPAPVAPVVGSLKDAFRLVPPKSRTAPPRPAPAPAVSPSPTAAVAVPADSSPPPSRTGRKESRPAESPAPTSRRADKQLLERRTVFVPDEVFEAVALRCDKTKLTRSQLVLLALNETHKRLAELVGEDLRPSGVTSTNDGLFEDLDLHVVRRAAGGRRQLTMLWTRAQLQVVDRLVEQVKAPDRSHMITVALRTWLNETPETP